MPTEVNIELDDAAVRRRLEDVASPETRRAVVEAAGEEVRQAALQHFRARQQEPEKTEGFPKFGESWGKRYFWAGSGGNSVAEAVGQPVYNAGEGTVTIAIDSPALAHKADPSPPPILPKGGRRNLAIPANARAAAWAGMPRDFDPGGGGMAFGFALTPDDRWMPALIAKRNHLRAVTRGKRKGAVEKAAADKATQGVGAPQYWLVRSVQTRHDPRALPDHGVLESRANARAAGTLDRLLAAAQGAS